MQLAELTYVRMRLAEARCEEPILETGVDWDAEFQELTWQAMSERLMRS